jgi:hypothetical protein
MVYIITRITGESPPLRMRGVLAEFALANNSATWERALCRGDVGETSRFFRIGRQSERKATGDYSTGRDSLPSLTWAA